MNKILERKDTSFAGQTGVAVPLEMKADSDTGEFEGYAATFGNEDHGGDTIIRGAFASSLASKNLLRIKMLYQHRPDMPIGHWIEAREDERGLFVRGQLALKVPKAAEVHELMMVGALDCMSIGFKTIRSERNEDEWTRRLLEIDLWEVSVVTFPMNDGAMVSQVKGMPRSKRDLEGELRDVVGLSDKEAKALIAGGYQAMQGQRDAGSGGNELSAILAEMQSARAAL